jgi:hypothetical protein
MNLVITREYIEGLNIGLTSEHRIPNAPNWYFETLRQKMRSAEIIEPSGRGASRYKYIAIKKEPV